MKTFNGKVLVQKLKAQKLPLLLCFLATFLEFFIFNYKHWESLLW